MQPDFTRPSKTGTVSPLAARLSSVAYVLGFVSVSPYVLFLLFLAAGALGILGLFSKEQYALLGTILNVLFLIPPLPTTVIAMVALRLMRDVPASVPQKVRANRAMGMGIIPLSLTLFFLFIKVASGGIL